MTTVIQNVTTQSPHGRKLKNLIFADNSWKGSFGLYTVSVSQVEVKVKGVVNSL
jgi:hypothetical protein